VKNEKAINHDKCYKLERAISKDSQYLPLCSPLEQKTDTDAIGQFLILGVKFSYMDRRLGRD